MFDRILSLLSKRKKLFSGLGIFLVLVIFLTGYLLLRKVDTSAYKTSQDTEDDENFTPEGDYTFLITIGTQEETCPLIFYAEFNFTDEEFTVESIDADTGITYEAEYTDYKTVFLDGGFTALRFALSENTDKTFSRYISITDKNFSKALKNLGYVDIELENDINLECGDSTLKLKSGVNSITGEDLANYLRYGFLTLKPSKREAKRSELFSAMLDSYLNEDNLDEGEELFATLVNLCQDTDISAFDYHNAGQYLEYLSKRQ